MRCHGGRLVHSIQYYIAWRCLHYWPAYHATWPDDEAAKSKKKINYRKATSCGQKLLIILNSLTNAVFDFDKESENCYYEVFTL